MKMSQMEENIPLNKKEEKKFKTSVAGIKNLLKKGKMKLPEKGKQQNDNRGVVYIGHIPHGFYEEQMRDFFKQFGKVTNVRVARSAKNAKSKGYGFVEFEEREVAEIVAETMNNYLMDKRLLKAECIPADRLMPNLFKGKNWVPNEFCPGMKNRKENKQNHNKEVSEEDWIQYCKKQLTRIHSIKQKLKELGIDFDFTPCDVPKQLANFDPASIKSVNLIEKKIKLPLAKSLEKSNEQKKATDKKRNDKEKNDKVENLIKGQNNHSEKKNVISENLHKTRKGKIVKKQKSKSILSTKNIK